MDSAGQREQFRHPELGFGIVLSLFFGVKY